MASTVGYDHYSDSLRYYKFATTVDASWSFPFAPDEPKKDMYGLTKLTKQQEKSLSKEDQALLRMGLVNADLTPTDEGFKYQRRFTFEQNRAELAKQAAAEIAELEAEAAKKLQK